MVNTYSTLDKVFLTQSSKRMTGSDVTDKSMGSDATGDLLPY